MITFSKPVIEIIQQRFSCRAYLESPIEDEKKHRLQEFMTSLAPAPHGAPVRFGLISATEQDRSTLKGLGTYGFIKSAAGFLIGAVKPGGKDMEDYGFCMEQIILFATDIGLGTCWLGGTFTRSGFAKKISAAQDEIIPAVASVGNIANPEQARNTALRRQLGAIDRLMWNGLFFQKKFGNPLGLQDAGPYKNPLAMVRLGPSASNKQPWRIVRDDKGWHFYLQRTKGYGADLVSRLLKLEDLQRVDMGIAMCHFELSAREAGLKGQWKIQEPAIEKPDPLLEYSVSWIDS